MVAKRKESHIMLMVELLRSQTLVAMYMMTQVDFRKSKTANMS